MRPWYQPVAACQSSLVPAAAERSTGKRLARWAWKSANEPSRAIGHGGSHCLSPPRPTHLPPSKPGLPFSSPARPTPPTKLGRRCGSFCQKVRCAKGCAASSKWLLQLPICSATPADGRGWLACCGGRSRDWRIRRCGWRCSKLGWARRWTCDWSDGATCRSTGPTCLGPSRTAKPIGKSLLTPTTAAAQARCLQPL